MFIGSPASGRKTLLLNKAEAIRNSLQVLRIAQHQVSLGRRTQRIHVTVGVSARQNVLASPQRIEKLVVEEKSLGQLEVSGISGSLIREKLILGHRITFVPGVLREVLAIVDGRLPVRHGFRWKVFRNGIGGATQYIQR